MINNSGYNPLVAKQEYFLSYMLRYNFKNVLDIGMGRSPYIVDTLIRNDRKVTSIDIKKLTNYENENFTFIEGNFLEYSFEDQSFDAILASHALEHNLNVGMFLDRVYDILKEDGTFFCLVPPHKTSIVGGHVVIGWNIGVLMYDLIMCGFDVRNGRFKKLGYNIAAFVQKRKDKTLPSNLILDDGDIEKLKDYFPNSTYFKNRFEGDIPEWNWFSD